MNKDNAKEYLYLVQALAEGKTIQTKNICGWTDMGEIHFIDRASSYRIKPEPLEFEMWVDERVDMVRVDMTGMPGWRKIKVREVL